MLVSQNILDIPRVWIEKSTSLGKFEKEQNPKIVSLKESRNNDNPGWRNYSSSSTS